MRARLKRKLKAKTEAKAAIPLLLEKAKKAYKKGDKALAKTYSKKIRFLYMKFKIKLPIVTKRQFCKHCDSILIPSRNCRIRAKDGKIIIFCQECRKYSRISIK
jgi:ribonuclease P protein subunit RPR2